MEMLICTRKADGHSDLYQASRWTLKIDRDKIDVSLRLVVIHLLSAFGLRVWTFRSWLSIYFPGTNWNVHLFSW